jgi:DNA-binding protein H-NS
MDTVNIFNEDPSLKKFILKQFKKLTKVMADKFSDIKTEFENFKTVIEAEHAEAREQFQKLDEKISQLETNILEGGTAEERAALISDIKSQSARVADIVNREPGTGPTEPGEGGNNSDEPIV